MPAPEVNQPKAQTMDVPSTGEINQQPVSGYVPTPLFVFCDIQLILS